MYKLTYETLRALRIKNKWFTHGSNYLFDRMVELAENGGSIDELAAIIWVCSDDATGTREQIKAALKAHERWE